MRSNISIGFPWLCRPASTCDLRDWLFIIFSMCWSWGKGENLTEASPRQRIWTRIETHSLERSSSTKQIVLYVSVCFCSSLLLRSCSQCASITQCLIFSSINQRKAPCVRHAPWVSAWPEWIHIYSWKPIWNCLIFCCFFFFEPAAHSICVWFTESKGHNRRALSAAFMHLFMWFPTSPLWTNMAQ